MRVRRRSVLRITARVAVAALGLLAALLGYCLLRPNLSPARPILAAGVERLPRTGRHDGMSDLTRWRGELWLANVASPWHFASRESRIVLRRSRDGHHWKEVTAFAAHDVDVRDPKLAVIRGRLHVYWLQNRGFPEPSPYATFVSTSPEGRHWQAPMAVEPRGWLLWRPQTLDGVNYYVTAYWHRHGRAALFRSTDGLRWEHVSDIATQAHVDETGFTFVGDRIVATARLEGVGPRPWVGDPRGATVIATATPPYRRWTSVVDMTARLDGPCLFAWAGQAYAVARYDALPQKSVVGSILSRKRTALYRVGLGGLRLLTLLPSAGDTSYPGVAMARSDLLISYYTSRTDRDYPWLLGMLMPSELRLARIPLTSIESLAARSGPTSATKG